jgi:ABC-type multidrug transport system fused ATPase/permease subunit
VVGILGAILTPILAMQKATSVSGTIFSMIDSKKVSSDGISEPEVSAYDNIELKGICFAYPSRSNVQVLKSLDAVFESGKTTALVGPSGAGKSTIVGLLEQWYDLKEDECKTSAGQGATTSRPLTPASNRTIESARLSTNSNQGVITIGGRDIAEVDLKWWRSQIGLVQQEPFLFNDTIFNNVAFGLLGTKWAKDSEASKREKVEKACKEAFADNFIRQLPDV